MPTELSNGADIALVHSNATVCCLIVIAMDKDSITAAETKLWSDAVLLLDQSRRRWPNNNSTLDCRIAIRCQA